MKINTQCRYQQNHPFVSCLGRSTWFSTCLPFLLASLLCFHLPRAVSLGMANTGSHSASGKPCSPQTVSQDHIVCVCNSTYCDTITIPEPVPGTQYLVYTSSMGGLRMDKKQFNSVNDSSRPVYTLDLNTKRQTILGFGGAFTDAAGINIASLPVKAQENLIKAYYSPDGIEYTVGRVPMASCDFSTHPYSYDDTDGDLNLTKFALAPEDLKFKIPYIQMAFNMTRRTIRMFGSPWSAPAWMKTNKNMTGKGSLMGAPGGDYYKAWANYFVKFLDSYKEHQIPFWGVTIQNEPIDGLEKDFPFQAMAFTPQTQRDFVKLDLGPALHAAGYGNISVMMLDDQRLFLLDWSKTVLSDPEAAKYISGIALHWYIDSLIPANVLDMTHDKFPDKFLFATEACAGSFPWNIPKVDLGSWSRGASYASDVLTDLNHWMTGWTDWNLALNLKGGPNWVSNFVDSPIIVNADKQEFYKQPMYYVLGHFSKFVLPGSVWISTKVSQEEKAIEFAAFSRPDGAIAVVIHNKGDRPVQLSLTDGKSGYKPVDSPPYSIQTVLWWL